MVGNALRSLFLGVLALASCAAPPVATEPGLELFVLGVAQDGGLPHLGCDKACCAEARRSGRELYPVSLGVHDAATGKLLLIEATPAIEKQVALLHRLSGQSGRGRAPVDGLLLTHAHIGHYLGLAHLGREVAGTRQLPVYLSHRFAHYLRGHGPWKQLVQLDQIALRSFEPGESFEPWPGLRITPIAVPHRDEFSDTMAYRIEGPRRTVLFVPDIDRWERSGDLIDRLFDDVDVAYVDGSFYDGSELPDRDMREIPHPPMVDTMRRLAGRGVRFIHLNHTNPVLQNDGLRAELEEKGFPVAVRGERVPL